MKQQKKAKFRRPTLPSLFYSQKTIPDSSLWAWTISDAQTLPSEVADDKREQVTLRSATVTQS